MMKVEPKAELRLWLATEALDTIIERIGECKAILTKSKDVA